MICGFSITKIQWTEYFQVDCWVRNHPYKDCWKSTKWAPKLGLVVKVTALSVKYKLFAELLNQVVKIWPCYSWIQIATSSGEATRSRILGWQVQFVIKKNEINTSFWSAQG